MEKLISEVQTTIESVTERNNQNVQELLNINERNNQNTQDLLEVQSKLKQIMDSAVPKLRRNDTKELVNLCSDEASKKNFIVGSKRSNAKSKMSKESKEKIEKFKEVVKKTKKFGNQTAENSEEQSSFIGVSNSIENSKFIMEQIDSNIPNKDNIEKKNSNLDLNEEEGNKDKKMQTNSISSDAKNSKKNIALPNFSPIPKGT